MRELARGVHVLERPQRFFGLEVGARMTALSLAGGVLVHSPLDVDPATVGPVRWVLSPNKLHHLYVRRWTDTGVEAWAAPGLRRKRPDVPFAGELTDAQHPFGDEIAVFPLRSFALTNEVVLLHRPSRTLVTTDLVFHFPRTAPALTRAAMWCACAYPGCRTSSLEQLGTQRALGREEIGALLALDFDRLIMAHGEVIEHGGREALARAYRWLGV